MAGAKIVKQADLGGRGNQVLLAVHQAALRPGQRAVEVEAGAAMVGRQLHSAPTSDLDQTSVKLRRIRHV